MASRRYDLPGSIGKRVMRHGGSKTVIVVSLLDSDGQVVTEGEFELAADESATFGRYIDRREYLKRNRYLDAVERGNNEDLWISHPLHR